MSAERFLVKGLESHGRLPRKARRICTKALGWADKQTGQDFLKDVPYQITDNELAIIKASVAEKRTLKILEHYPVVKGTEIFLQLDRFFKESYERTLEKLLRVHHLDINNQTLVTSIEYHLEFCANMAKNFPWGNSSWSDITLFCEQIRRNRPSIFPTKHLGLIS